MIQKTEEINPEKMLAGIQRRKMQLLNLKYWMNTMKGYRLQMNFCIPGSSDHCCVTISGCRAPEMGAAAILFLEEQIASLEKKYANLTQKQR